MRTLSVLALWSLVVSCHIDKLLNSEKPPPSQGPPDRVAFSSALQSARAGEPITPPVQVTVLDSVGRVTLRDTLVILSLGANPSGDSLRGTKQVRSVNGVATFANLRLDKAASGYTLTAAAPELRPDTSGAFSVMPAPATQLLFTVQPSAAMQDSPIDPPVQVTAYDSLGNKATNFTGPIRVALGTDGSVSKDATLTAVPDPVSAVAGVATFNNLRINRPGTGYTLTAAFGNAAPIDTSVPFDITLVPPPPPPPPTHLGFTQQPLTTVAGATITPPVQVVALDAAEHVVQGFTGTISLALGANPGGGTLSGGAPVDAVNGVATFPNLSIDQAGNGYTLRATASGLTAATSDAFDVTAPPSGSLRVTTATSGDNLDADGYLVTVDGATSQVIGINNSSGVTFTGLGVGSHTVELGGVATNCTVTAPNPRSVAVTAGGTATTAFVVSCTALTGSLSVTTSTSGASQDPDGYSFAVDGGTPQSIGVNQTITLNGVPVGSHTVVLSGVAGNCTVTGGTSRTVTVSAGGTANVPFAVSCSALPPPTGDLTVTAATTGQDLDPNGYTVTVDGGQSRSLGINTSTTYTGLTAASHTVELTGIAANCTVSGQNPRSVTVATSGTTTTFTITCAALPPPTGDLTVTAATTGQDLDPNGYTVTVDGGQSRSLGINASTTYPGLTAASHTVELTGIAANCTVSGQNPRSVTVSTSGTTTTFTITCAALPPPNQPPVAVFPAPSCSGLSCSFTDQSSDPDGTIASRDWDFGDGSTHASQANPSHTYGAGGTYTVRLTVTDNQGATDNVTRSVTVTAPPPPNQPPVAAFGSSCTLLVCSFTSTSSDPDGSIASYRWTFGDGGSATEQNPTHVYTAPGTYTVTLTVTDNQGATDNVSHTVTVAAPPPNVAPSVNAGPDETAVTGLLYSMTWSFSDGNHNGPWSYTIDWGDGTTSSGTASGEGSFSAGHTYVILLPRSFTVTVTVTDASGAAGSDSKVVSVVLL